MQKAKLSEALNSITDECVGLLDDQLIFQAAALLACIRDRIFVTDKDDTITTNAIEAVIYLLEEYQDIFEVQVNRIVSLTNEVGEING